MVSVAGRVDSVAARAASTVRVPEAAVHVGHRAWAAEAVAAEVEEEGDDDERSTFRIAGWLGVLRCSAFSLGAATRTRRPRPAPWRRGPPQQFASPEDAAAALVTAAEKYDVATLKAFLAPPAGRS